MHALRIERDRNVESRSYYWTKIHQYYIIENQSIALEENIYYNNYYSAKGLSKNDVTLSGGEEGGSVNMTLK